MATAARQRSRRRLLELAFLCLGAALLVWVAFPFVPTLTNAERSVQDRIIQNTGPDPGPSDFVFVAIDDPSMKLDQLWPEDLADSAPLRLMAEAGFPWPRSVYAAALDRLIAAGARLVIFDLIFDAPRPGDDAFRTALDHHHDRVVIGSNFTLDTVNPAHPQLATTSLNVPTPALIPEPNADPRVGFVNFLPEPDQIIRSARYVLHYAGRDVLSLSAAAARQLDTSAPLPPAGSSRLFRLPPTRDVPVVPFYTLFLAADWQRTLRNGEVFRDKIVFVGPSAAILQDNHLVTGGRKIPGPMIHLHALAALLRGEFYERAGPGASALLLALAAGAAFALALPLARRPMAALVACAASFALFIGVTVAAAHWWDYLLPVVQPGITLALAGTLCIAWNFARERRESGRMRSMLERYVSRNLVREVLDHRDDFLQALGGTRRPVTVFFSDVRGFTTLSERADAGAVVEQLNEYLGEMVSVIFRHHGTVDKFMGDGIMAVWGNVVSEGPATDAARALRAALEMLERLPALNAAWTARGLPAFHIGIGLHHGDAVFGNIGSAEKMEPTVIGDTVNLASRVEGLTKKYHLTLCVTRPLADLLRDQFRFRSVDLVQVVGKSQPIEILTALGPADAGFPPWLDLYDAALDAYRQRRFTDATSLLRRALDDVPDDPLIPLYLTRCATYETFPPPPDWNGAEIATSK